MASRRDPWIDNAKMVLVTIVVIGHAVVLLPTSDLESQAYDFIYYFHIPVFVLLSGYLSRSFRYTPKHLWALVTTLVVPYLLFSWLMAQFRHHVGGEALLDPIFTNPRWPMWYLAVLVIWRLATPVLKRHWAMVPASIAVSLLAGQTNQELFDLNRAMGLLPFFVVGLHLPDRVIDRVKQRSTRIAAAVALLALWVFADFTNRFWSTSWLYYRSSYADLGADLGDGAWIRARLIVISLIGCFAVLSLIPQRRTFLSDMGAFSLVVYLMHGFFVRYAGYQDWDSYLPDSPLLSLIVVVVLAVLLALLLAWPPVAQRLNYLVDPVNSVVKARAKRAVGIRSGR
ncbi:MAG: acyltransferase family protein [Nocardioides sp.]